MNGTIAEMTTQVGGGLRSGMGYTGCRSIKEFQEKSKFIRITRGCASLTFTT